MILYKVNSGQTKRHRFKIITQPLSFKLKNNGNTTNQFRVSRVLTSDKGEELVRIRIKSKTLKI